MADLPLQAKAWNAIVGTLQEEVPDRLRMTRSAVRTVRGGCTVDAVEVEVKWNMSGAKLNQQSCMSAIEGRGELEEVA